MEDGIARTKKQQREDNQRLQAGDWETPCPNCEDKKHCNHWYDDEPCCACGDDGAKGEANNMFNKENTKNASQEDLNYANFLAKLVVEAEGVPFHRSEAVAVGLEGEWETLRSELTKQLGLQR